MRWKILPAAGLLLLLTGCGDEQAKSREQAEALAARGAQLAAQLNTQLHNYSTINKDGNNTLLIQLAFGEEADLDLYVTDPHLETVYFANKAGKSGGKISADHRCDSQPLRVEEVRFEMPLSGRYRIGVDFPNRCKSADPERRGERAAYALSVLHNGERQSATGTVGFRFFEVNAYEFDIEVQNNEERVHD